MENLNDKDVLPKLSNIPEKSLAFINNQTFNPLQNPSNFEDLAIKLDNKCTHLQTHLQNLQNSLGSSLISWGSRLIRAKSSLEDFTLNLEDLSIISTHYMCENSEIEKLVWKDLTYIELELRRIESINQYAGVALKLETLVGDLEDAVLSALNQQTGYIFSRTGPNSRIPGHLHAKLDNVHRAVKAINNIEEIILDVLKNHPQWCKLLKAVDSRVEKTLTVLRPQVIADHRSLLSSLGWPPKSLTSNTENGETMGIPNPLLLMEGEKKQSYSQSFLALCALQHVQIRREKRRRMSLRQRQEEDLGLWAIDELVSSIASKIENHLVKWIDQPEFMFALVFKITHDFIQGVDDVLQPLIDEAMLVNCSAKEAWVSSMVQILSGFLGKKVFPVLAERYRKKETKSDAISSWLHVMDQIVRFDKRMLSIISSETYLLPSSARSMSALSLFCDRPDWLNIWAKVELKDAWNKLKAEIIDEKAWSIKNNQKQEKTENVEFFLSTREDHKAPLVAEFALKSAWEIIQRCQTLPGNARRIQFIKSGPTKFLWRFFKALLSWSKSVDMHGYDAEENIIKICQLINAARFSEFKLQEWSEDVDLLELNLAEKGLINVDSTNGNLFFEEEIESLIEMETNWLMELITYVLHQFENHSFYYFQNVEQFQQVSEGETTISDNLIEALDNLRSHLNLINEHLNSNDFLDTWRSIADGLDHFIFRSLFSLGVRFSNEGTNRLMIDMEGLFYAFKSFCIRPEAFFPYIRDSIRVLKLEKNAVDNLKFDMLESAKGSDCLSKYGISSLSVDQTLQILNNRTFMV